MEKHITALLSFPRNSFQGAHEEGLPAYIQTFLDNISESPYMWAAQALLPPGNYYHFCLWS